MPRRVAVDLFAGGGGLSLGLEQAGFLVSAAVELDATACQTYRANHPGAVVFESDIRKITGNEIIRTSPSNRIDLIAACPPCQGFSTLTAKYKKEDARNELILEFARLVREILPFCIMMENVPGLAKKGFPIFDIALQEFQSLGYHLSYDVVNVADYGVPQQRRRLVLLGCRSKLIDIPKATHSANPSEDLKPWVTVRDAIQGADAPITLQKAIEIGGPNHVGWNVVRSMSELNEKRLLAALPGKSRTQLPEHLRPKCHQGKSDGFSNVYGRMSWDLPSPTITGGCATLSKGRFGHPSMLRTISVREAASLQTFPTSYRFATNYIDKVCNIIGNALPPHFAKIMASPCLAAINEEYDD